MSKALIPSLRTLPTVAAVAVLGVSSVAVAVDVDPAIEPYKDATGVSGNLNSIGSDTLNNCMTFWAEAFQTKYPNVQIGIEGKGSATAPPALTQGTAQLGPMSREMKKEEIDDFEAKYHYKPTQIKVAIDALAVFVHKDNPLTGLTLTQVDSIFSSTFKRGGTDITKWGDLGLTGDWSNKAISLYGRNSASGTYSFFKEHPLKKGDFKSTVKEQPGSSAVVSGVADELGGIGYSGIGYVTSSVKALPIGDKPETLAEPTYENCLNGKYPMARFLYIYVNKQPGKPLDTLTGEFINYVLSKEGQEDVVKDKFFPLTAKLLADAKADLAK
jgi:phosphate transport system substrate-binding protein